MSSPASLLFSALFAFRQKNRLFYGEKRECVKLFLFFSIISVERRPFYGQEFPLGERFSGSAYQ